MSKTNVYVSIQHDPPFFKHWAMFVDMPDTTRKRVFNAMGSEGRRRYESYTSIPQGPEYIELFHIFDIDESKAGEIERYADAIPIRNEVKAWNCQDYVMDLLGELEKAGLVDSEDGEYMQRKKTPEGRIEGFIWIIVAGWGLCFGAWKFVGGGVFTYICLYVCK